MKLRVIGSLAVAAAAVATGSASPAFAATGSPPASSSAAQPNIQPGSYCVDGDGSLCLYYSANGTGSRVPIFGDITCYDSCGGINYVFDNNAEGSSGYGDDVRNATHYVYNNDSSNGYAVFVSPNYVGYYDEFCADGHSTCTYSANPPGYSQNSWHGNLAFTQNNNASQEYLSQTLPG